MSYDDVRKPTYEEVHNQLMMIQRLTNSIRSGVWFTALAVIVIAVVSVFKYTLPT
jgi:hypothetical protein